MLNKINEARKSTWLLFGLYFLTFLFACCIMVNSPLVTDDIHFFVNGSVTFRQALHEALHYGNGRLLGNLTAIILVRRRLLMTVEKSLIMVAIAALAAHLISGKDHLKKPFFFLLTAVLMFGLDGSIFSDVFAWTSGFQNYVPSILAMLACAAAFLHEPKKSSGKIADYVLLVLFGVTGQLYMELHSLVNALIIGLLLVVCAKKWRKQLTKSIVWFASIVVGSGIMVLVPAVFPAATDDVEVYRDLHLHGLRDIYTTVLKNASVTVRSFFACRVLIVLLCAAVLIFVRKQEGLLRRKKLLGFCCIGLLSSAAFGVFYDFLVNQSELKKFYVIYDTLSILSVFVFLICLVVVFAQMPKSVEKTLLLISVAAAVFPLAPMMIVEPFGSRCLLLSYCFLSACVLLLMKLIFQQAQPADCRKAVWGGFCAFAALAVCLSLVFMEIGWMHRQQIAYIEEKVKEHPQQIEAIRLPTNYIHTPCIWSLNRLYYNEKEKDIEFVFLDFDEWYANRQAEGWIK